ncbi:uncharacterized protein MCYG_04320 [Microsporum canis CBS 113480]|uniref:Uncharacterized protein n=1 Tax=Arthroderma otae (strain ATCC MYA-4605 / CBS 113480) TaxID=554155 RepID=C5FPI5_ARTOC|nr:uncharacterized protein MCYG_04320 [Microsporum canis CBS 113480]EEQ31501.1 predicted protein [Microsporum canis CBS 113480]
MGKGENAGLLQASKLQPKIKIDMEREFDRVAFDSHRDEHTQIQNRLQRQARTYGARYEPDNTPREPPQQPIPSSDQQEPPLALRPKEAEVVTPEQDASQQE